ncbi:hypothetical protein H312_00725 [Anncaliia algerae PRA339]|uniref:PSP1 C-terminal domain-containing protein n=1 Tax=Anncaliia algerae PRA339 TaxID=1288291 RepID=A0A059F4C6_9MICR|nr:hypothetical protein H312_00725 [Anncaliia algerae PRA339]
MKNNLLSRKFENKIWLETDEKWNYKDNPVNIADWRIVGSSMFNKFSPTKNNELLLGQDGKQREEIVISGMNIEIIEPRNEEIESKEQVLYYKDDNENENIKEDEKQSSTVIIKGPKKTYTLSIKDSKKYTENKFVLDYHIFQEFYFYIIEFESKRLDIGFTKLDIEIDSYVILEADRGEDCGKIISSTNIDKYMNLLESYSLSEEIVPKKIIRIATNDDLKVLEKKKRLETDALKYCIDNNYLDMDIVSCEYQWDMKKLTFFFMSKDRVDFRDLVKDLYKTYKTRIWMCCVEKTRNWCLKSLVERNK